MAARWYVPGPCTVTYGGSTLGFTKAGVTISIKTGLVPITDDEHGTEPADYIRSGKSAVVEAIFNNMTDLHAASQSTNGLWIAGLLSNYKSGTTQVGKMTFDGDPTDNANFLGQQLWITERNTANIWKAKYAVPSDPQAFLLAATQENLVPLSFVLSIDENNKLFYELPAYMTPSD